VCGVPVSVVLLACMGGGGELVLVRKGVPVYRSL
jgi:hypothetical protein